MNKYRVHAGFGGEKLVSWVDFGNITNCYMIGIEIHRTNSQNQPNISTLSIGAKRLMR